MSIKQIREKLEIASSSKAHNFWGRHYVEDTRELLATIDRLAEALRECYKTLQVPGGYLANDDEQEISELLKELEES